MTLPHGFGKGSNTDQAKRRDCECTFIQKSVIGVRGTHGSFSTRHDGRKGITALLVFVFATIGIIAVGLTISDIAYDSREPIRTNIEGFSCNQLAEYIADRDDNYEYAEHRYEWLCVNEQIKEFQS